MSTYIRVLPLVSSKQKLDALEESRAVFGLMLIGFYRDGSAGRPLSLLEYRTKQVFKMTLDYRSRNSELPPNRRTKGRRK